MNGHWQSTAAKEEERRWQQLEAEEEEQRWQQLDLLDPSISTMNSSSSSNHAAADQQIQRLNAQVINLETGKARLETRIEIMEKILAEMMGRRRQEQLTAGQGSSQPPPMLLHLLGMSGNGDGQLQQEQQIETLHGVVQIQQQLQNGHVGGGDVQQPTAPAAEADVADAVVDAANVGAADPAAAASEPNRHQPLQQQSQLVEHPYMALARFFAFLALFLLVGISKVYFERKLSDQKTIFQAELSKAQEKMAMQEEGLQDYAQKMAYLEKQLAEEKARFADLEKRMMAEKAQELAKANKEKQMFPEEKSPKTGDSLAVLIWFIASVGLSLCCAAVGLYHFLYVIWDESNHRVFRVGAFLLACIAIFLTSVMLRFVLLLWPTASACLICFGNSLASSMHECFKK